MGSKIYLITERTGLPLSIGISGAYTHDSQTLEPLVRGISPIRSRRGVDSSQRLGRHRWTVERTVSWLTGCRRLHRRYERRAEHVLAFAVIAAALICFRRLSRQM
ncbi:DDE family transposase [Streptomyces sp. 2132.2]|nr:DDE family transposase [Streptomyces sp. 2132.2]